MTAGRGWAYTGVALGAVTSVAANIAHSYVPPAGSTSDFTPPTGSVISAVFWPVALVVGIEVLARAAWPAEARWLWLRYGGLVPVATVAAVVSYLHMSGLLAYYGESKVAVILGPLAVDGLMVMATGALIATSPARHRTAVAGGMPARGDVATPPPVAITVPGPGTLPVATPAPVVATSEPWVATEPEPVATPRPAIPVTDMEKAARVAAAKASGLSQKATAEETGIPRTTVRRYWDTPHLTAVPKEDAR